MLNAYQDLWQIKLSLGAVVRQERAQSAALAPMIEEVQVAVLTLSAPGTKRGLNDSQWR